MRTIVVRLDVSGGLSLSLSSRSPLFFGLFARFDRTSNAFSGRHTQLRYGNPKEAHFGGCTKRERTRIVGTAASEAVAATKTLFSSLRVHSLPSRTLVHTLIQYSFSLGTLHGHLAAEWPLVAADDVRSRCFGVCPRRLGLYRPQTHLERLERQSQSFTRTGEHPIRSTLVIPLR